MGDISAAIERKPRIQQLSLALLKREGTMKWIVILAVLIIMLALCGTLLVGVTTTLPFPIEWIERAISIITLMLCGTVLLGRLITRFSCPNSIVYGLKVAVVILALTGIISICWGISDFLSISSEDEGGGVLANPATPITLIGVFCGILTAVGLIILHVADEFPTGFQKEVLKLLGEIIGYVKH